MSKHEATGLRCQDLTSGRAPAIVAIAAGLALMWGGVVAAHARRSGVRSSPPAGETTRAATGTGRVLVAVAGLRDGPVLAGGGVLWSEQAGSNGRLVLLVHGRRSVQRLPPLGRVPGRRPAYWQIQPLESSGSYFAATRMISDCTPQDYCPARIQVVAGRLNGPTRVVYDDGPIETDPACGPFAEYTLADATILLTATAIPCERRPEVGALVNVRTGQRRRFIFRLDARAAGHLLAFAHPSDQEMNGITVYDLRRRRVIRRLDLRVLNGVPGFHGPPTVDGWALQADGKITVAYARPTVPYFNYGLAWFGAHSPKPHVLAAAATQAGTGPGHTRLVFAGDRIAYISAPDPDGTHWLSIVGLNGAVRRITQLEPRPSYGSTPQPTLTQTFDFDGRHLIWGSRGEYIPCTSSPGPCAVHFTHYYARIFEQTIPDAASNAVPTTHPPRNRVIGAR